MSSAPTEYARGRTDREWCEVLETAREWIPPQSAERVGSQGLVGSSRVREWSSPSAGQVLLSRRDRASVGDWGHQQDLPRKSDDLERTFRRLVDSWREETRFLSSVQAMSTSRWYQMIIGLGEPALPLLLHELEKAPDHWFWALRSIAREDPVDSYEKFSDAVAAWLEWGRKKGLI